GERSVRTGNVHDTERVATLKLRKTREGLHLLSDCSHIRVSTPREDADKQGVTTIAMPIPRAEAKTGASAHGDELARESATSSSGIARWLLMGVCLAAALVGRLAYLSQPFDDDGAMFVYLGRVVCEGRRFCHDVIDNKFPSVGLMTSLAYRCFGNAWAGYVLTQTALGIGGALLLSRSAGRHLGEAAKLPAMLFALVYFNFYVAVYGGFQLETMQTFFAILAAGAAMEALSGKGDSRDAFVVGLAAGCAAMLKPTGGSVLAAFAIATLLTSYRSPLKVLRHALASACGLAIPAAVVLIYLVGTDVLRDMPGLYRQIARYAAETPFEMIDLLKPVMVLLIIGFPMLVRGWIGRRDATAAKPARPIVIFLIAWLALEFFGAIAQRRMYPYHFLPLAAPAALCYAAIPRREPLARIAAAVLPAAVASLIFGAMLIARADEKPHLTAASEYLLVHAAPSDRFWQDWMARTLVETGLQPGSRVPLTFLFMNHDAAPQEFSRMILDDFERLRPKYVFLSTDLGARIDDVTKRSPELRASPARAANYRRAHQDIERYVKINYIAESVVGHETVYVRRDEGESAR
ncbi:MAG: hypothetical protein QOF78_754, partial [Phycisphaerales bacterium]|nr:hypothetical protein [Phycisphaerales bacterium]